MSPFDVWSTYMAIKLHFDKGSYDAFKFNFCGPKLKRSTFEAKKDRYFFEKTARKFPKKEDVITYFLANHLEGNFWVGSMNDQAPMNWIGKMQRLDYTFRSDISLVSDLAASMQYSFDDCFKVSPSRPVPLIIELLQSQKISLESVVMLEELLNFIPRINKLVSDPLGIFEELFQRVVQYKPFIARRMDHQKSKLIVIKSFT
jgi:hypothetical protein